MAPQELGRKWVPRDADELLEAFDEGLLEETHWCDLKADLGSNRESAKDMAAFSIDGGTVIIGIDEKMPNGEPRHPVTLKGLPEKLERIARMAVHPPLQISCTTIESGDGDGKGYVLVHIPASPLAPHQVDGIYYTRVDKTVDRMPEPEVERLYQRRAQWNHDAAGMLAEHMGAVPMVDQVHTPRLFAVARPVGGRPDMCRGVVSGREWRGKVGQLRIDVTREESIARLLDEFGVPPTDSWLSSNLPMSEKTASGALLSNRMSPGQPAKIRDRRLEISEGGEMRLFFNALHRQLGVNGVEFIGLELAYVVLIVREFLAFARCLSERSGHSAMWDFGLGMDGLSEVRPILNVQYPFFASDHLGYPGGDYRQTTRASVLELEKTPGAVAERLGGQLYRTFDVSDETFLSVFADPTEETDAPD